MFTYIWTKYNVLLLWFKIINLVLNFDNANSTKFDTSKTLALIKCRL